MADYAIHDTTLTGISNVIRKKDGTSALIDPADYADRINLMGMLEEKTVSSSPIVTFSDGADAVPLKKCEITLPASLDGYSQVDVVHTGKNLLPNTAQTATENGVTYTVNSDGTISLSGTCNADTNFYIYSGFTFPKLGQYYFSGCPSGGSTSTYRVFLTNFGADVGSGYALNITNLSVTTSIRINIKSGVVTDGLVFKPQIEIGATATDFEPYSGTTHTASLGRTIYGGEVDIVNGEGQEKYKIFTASDVTSLYWNGKKAQQVDTNHRASFRIALPSGYITVNNSLCNELSYTINIASGSGEYEGYQLIATAGIYFCIDLADIGMENATSDTPDEDFINAIHNYGDNLKFVVELATQETFTFDPVPIDSKLGNNTIWSEQGDTEVTYRGQGTVTVYPNAEEASF